MERVDRIYVEGKLPRPRPFSVEHPTNLTSGEYGRRRHSRPRLRVGFECFPVLRDVFK